MNKRMRMLLFLGKSLLAAYIVTGISLFLLAMFLFHFCPNDSIAVVGISVIYSMACLLGGFLAGKQFRRKKGLFGILVGFLYFGFLFLCGIIGNNGGVYFGQSVFLTFLMCLFTAGIGGMLS